MKMRNNGSRIFMTELMFAILFFIVIAAVCVQCFGLSYVKSKDAEELTEAVNLASNAAEEFMACDATELEQENFTDYYDSDWVTCDADSSEYKVTGIVSKADDDYSYYTMSIRVSTMDEEEIYSLEVERALPLYW